jgi:hypothetical protein
MYIDAAGKENINPDIAIAQMCRATGFLHNKTLMLKHNYSGQGGLGGYSNMRQGVAAHIQLLKSYASGAWQSSQVEATAGPRRNIQDAFRGAARTLEDISLIWAPDNPKGYENAIRDIIYDMRLFIKP